MNLSVSRTSTLLTLVGLAAAVVVYLFAAPVHRAVNEVAHILTTADAPAAILGFRDFLLRHGAWAPVFSAALMVLQSVVAPLPAFVITFANGLLFGWAWGAVLSWSSAMAGAALCFWISRSLGRPPAERLVGGARALEVSDLFFRRYGRRAVLVARLLPFVSFDLVSYGAGLTSMTFRSFFLATGVGQLPATLLYSYLGQSLTGSVRVLFWVFSVTAALLVAGWSVGPIVLRRIRRQEAGEPAAVSGPKVETP